MSTAVQKGLTIVFVIVLLMAVVDAPHAAANFVNGIFDFLQALAHALTVFLRALGDGK